MVARSRYNTELDALTIASVVASRMMVCSKLRLKIEMTWTSEGHVTVVALNSWRVGADEVADSLATHVEDYLALHEF